jgi:hypothetical protein
MAFPFDDSSAVAVYEDEYALDDKSLKSAASSTTAVAAGASPTRASRLRSILRLPGGGATTSSSLRRRVRHVASWRGIRPLAVPALASGAVASSLFSLTVSTHVAVALASALTVAVSAVVLVQQRRLAVGGAVQRSNAARQEESARRLRTERERLYRRVLQLDSVAERHRDVQRQLSALLSSGSEAPATKTAASASGGADPTENRAAAVDAPRQRRPSDTNDIPAAIRVAGRYKDAVTKLQHRAQREVLMGIARAALLGRQEGEWLLDGDKHSNQLDGDRDDFDAVVELLLSRLREVRGASFDEGLVREYLRDGTSGAAESAPEPPGGSVSALPVPGLVHLLRQAISDGELFEMASAPSVPGSPQRRKRRVRAQQQLQYQNRPRKNLSTVFTFDPERVLLTGFDEGVPAIEQPNATVKG